MALLVHLAETLTGLRLDRMTWLDAVGRDQLTSTRETLEENNIANETRIQTLCTCRPNLHMITS